MWVDKLIQFSFGRLRFVGQSKQIKWRLQMGLQVEHFNIMYLTFDLILNNFLLFLSMERRSMANHISTANLNLLNGTLLGSMHFEPGLNIISGENGTLKTQLLQSLRGTAAVASEPGQQLRMQAISPKRNSERRAAETIIQVFRQNNRTWETNLQERINSQINMSGFDNYPSLGDLYYLVFEHRCKDGTDRRTHMDVVTSEFNDVIRSVFLQYELSAIWDDALGAPKISMLKNTNVKFPIESLSMGEQEVLSLILSMSTSKNNVDVYLIDEPEVHLNWHLEERLFLFLDEFCEVNNKQAIVVTHSRTIFKSRFLPKTQFLRWGENQKVTWGRDLTSQQRTRLAGDAIEIVALGNFERITLFVEDAAHAEFINAIASLFGVDVNTSTCGGAANVKSLYKYQRKHGPWANAYFMIDGDNQGNPFPEDAHFIHLPYYCIENLILDPDVLGYVYSKSKKEVQQCMIEIFKKKRQAIFHKNKFFDFLADSLTCEHMTFERLKTFDASVVLKDIIENLGQLSLHDLLPVYLNAARDLSRLETLVPSQLLNLIRTVEELEIKEDEEGLTVDAYQAVLVEESKQ
jgi:predicted ATPase